MVILCVKLQHVLLVGTTYIPSLAFRAPSSHPVPSKLPNDNDIVRRRQGRRNQSKRMHDVENVLLERIDQFVSLHPETDPSSLPSHSSILANINRDHERDVAWAKASPLPFESEANGNNHFHSIQYEPINDITSDIPIAIQTESSTPLLNDAEVQLLRSVSQFYWDRQCSGGDGASEKSRFTYQRRGNSEAHLSDVVKYAQQFNFKDFPSLVQDLLLNRVYPWVREVYLSKEEGGGDLELYVYDSLFIRYNATRSDPNHLHSGDIEHRRRVGAGQPLHRDLGYASVNIMLNSEKDFNGGGTFFEDQLKPMVLVGELDDGVCPIKPPGPGHAIVHLSSCRHAGAATFSGVRDILVMFLAATKKEQHRSSGTDSAINPVPQWECNARIKSTARAYSADCCESDLDQLLCRIRHHRLAIEQVMDDGEAWHYLGMALLDHYNHRKVINDAEKSWSQCEHSLELANLCLDEATKRTPCDGRLYNNLGIASERLLELAIAKEPTQSSKVIEQLREKIRDSYHRSLMIHSTCERMGCDTVTDYESTCLNYGLFLSKQDEFDNAANVLSKIVSPNDAEFSNTNDDAAAWARQRVLHDARQLLSFCEKQRCH